MTTKLINRRALVAVTAALAFGVAAPAGARPFDLDSGGSLVPAGYQPVSAQPVTHTASSDSVLEFVLVGSGGAAVALIGAGGASAVLRRRRRQATATRHSTIAA